MTNIAFMILIVVLALPLVSAQLMIDSFTALPEKVEPGKDVLLELQLENAGDEDVENIVVRLDLTQVPFAPVGSSTEKAIDELRDHRREKMQFTLRALPDAQAKIYKIPVVISSGTLSTTSLIGIEVAAPAHLDVLQDNSEVLTIGQQSKVILKFVNDGLAQVQFLKVTLRQIPGYEIVSAPSLYIGEVDIGDFETEEFTIIPLTEDPILALDLEYRDASNQQFTAAKLIQMKVYSAEEAKQLGLVVEGKGWTYGIIVLIVIAAFIFWRRRKKRKNAP